MFFVFFLIWKNVIRWWMCLYQLSLYQQTRHSNFICNRVSSITSFPTSLSLDSQVTKSRTTNTYLSSFSMFFSLSISININDLYLFICLSLLRCSCCYINHTSWCYQDQTVDPRDLLKVNKKTHFSSFSSKSFPQKHASIIIASTKHIFE